MLFIIEGKKLVRTKYFRSDDYMRTITETKQSMANPLRIRAYQANFKRIRKQINAGQIEE